jgi:hypothetical protein
MLSIPVYITSLSHLMQTTNISLSPLTSFFSRGFIIVKVCRSVLCCNIYTGGLNCSEKVAVAAPRSRIVHLNCTPAGCGKDRGPGVFEVVELSYVGGISLRRMDLVKEILASAAHDRWSSEDLDDYIIHCSTIKEVNMMDET